MRKRLTPKQEKAVRKLKYFVQRNSNEGESQQDIVDRICSRSDLIAEMNGLVEKLTGIKPPSLHKRPKNTKGWPK